MRRYYLQSGLWMSVLTVLIFGGLYVAADLNATDRPSNTLNIDGGFWSDIGTGFASDKTSGRSTKIAAQNSFSLSLDANSAAGDQAVTSVNTSADQDVSIQVFGSRSGQSETGMLTARVELQVSTAPCPDFDGDGTIGIGDFLIFVDVFGSRQGDEKYEARYDLDGNGEIGISDFLIFIQDFGKDVPPSPVVAIPDANLRAAIEAALGKERGAPITQAEMATLDILVAGDAEITDLTGLAFAINLTRAEPLAPTPSRTCRRCRS